jgi:hypothetical protein
MLFLLKGICTDDSFFQPNQLHFPKRQFPILPGPVPPPPCAFHQPGQIDFTVFDPQMHDFIRRNSLHPFQFAFIDNDFHCFKPLVFLSVDAVPQADETVAVTFHPLLRAGPPRRHPFDNMHIGFSCNRTSPARSGATIWRIPGLTLYKSSAGLFTPMPPRFRTCV